MEPMFVQKLGKPSSTTQSVVVASAGMTAIWAVYNWLSLGPPAPEVVVSSTTGFISAFIAWVKRENVLPITRPE